MLNIRSPLPKEPKEERGGASGSSCRFNRLEDNALYMEASSWDDSGVQKWHTRVFKQKVATKYGKFGGVAFWADGDTFIPLPYDL